MDRDGDEWISIGMGIRTGISMGMDIDSERGSHKYRDIDRDKDVDRHRVRDIGTDRNIDRDAEWDIDRDSEQ